MRGKTGHTEYHGVVKQSAAKMRTDSALDIKEGYTAKINGRKYTLVKKYPFIYRFEDSSGNFETLTKGDVVQLRGNTLGECVTDWLSE